MAAAAAILATALRAAAAWALGDGAPFGPDGTGVEAAVSLGGHLYPAHVALVAVAGSAATVSVLSGTVLALALAVWERGLGLPVRAAWLAVTLPPAVYTGALAAGDAPALAVVACGAALATWGRWGGVVGGALAVASVLVKPVALPALALLAPLPWSWAGALLAAAVLRAWLLPLVAPVPGSGLLGSWWWTTGGLPPAPATWVRWTLDAVRALALSPGWACPWLVVLALAAAVAPGVPRALRRTAWAPLVAALAVAGLFGDRLDGRYLAGALLASTGWVACVAGRLTPALALALLLPSAAVVTQVAAERARQDPLAGVPVQRVVGWPPVPAGALFDDASTPGATALRQEAHRLARELPPGATIEVERRPHGREGELVWPLQVVRPDVQVVRR